MAEKNTFYSFTGINPGGVEWFVSPGLALIRKEDAEKFGGWDENYSGEWGGEDGKFRKDALKSGLSHKKVPDITAINHAGGCSDIEDVNAPLKREKIDMVKPALETNLRFKWKKIHENRNGG